jgi:hypothetical protein
VPTVYGDSLAEFLKKILDWTEFRAPGYYLLGRGGSYAFDSPLRRFLAHSERVDDQNQIERVDVFTHIGVPEEDARSPSDSRLRPAKFRK